MGLKVQGNFGDVWLHFEYYEPDDHGRPMITNAILTNRANDTIAVGSVRRYHKDQHVKETARTYALKALKKEMENKKFPGPFIGAVYQTYVTRRKTQNSVTKSQSAKTNIGIQG